MRPRLAWLLAIGAIVLFAQAWLPTHDQDSLLFSVISRNMAESGDWVNLTYTKLYHREFYEHPPLVIWLQAAAFRLLGTGNVVVRLVGGLFGLLGLWAVYALASGGTNPDRGFWAGIILLTSFKYFQYAPKCRLDVPLTALIAVAVFYISRARSSPRWFVAAGAATGLALLAKGPVGLAPVAVAAIAYPLLGEWRKLCSRWVVLGLLALVLVPLPWVARQLHDNDLKLYDRYVVYQVGETFAEGREKDEGSALYYPAFILKRYWPWLLTLVPGLWLAIRRRREEPVGVLSLVWAVVILAGISLSSGKRDYYLLPAAAPMAVLSAIGLQRLLKERWRLRLAQLLMVAAVVFLAVSFTPVRLHGYDTDMMAVMTKAGEWLGPDEVLLAWEAPKKKWAVIAFAAWYARREAREIDDNEFMSRVRMGKHCVFLMAEDNLHRLPYEGTLNVNQLIVGDYVLLEVGGPIREGHKFTRLPADVLRTLP